MLVTTRWDVDNATCKFITFLRVKKKIKSFFFYLSENKTKKYRRDLLRFLSLDTYSDHAPNPRNRLMLKTKFQP